MEDNRGGQPDTARTAATSDTKATAQPGQGGEAGNKKKRRVGPNLAGTIVVPYVDDGTLYRERIPQFDREKVFFHYLEHKVRRELPKKEKPFIVPGGGDPDVNEMKNYPSTLVIGLKIISSVGWDYLYLTLLFLWMGLIAQNFDPTMEEYKSESSFAYMVLCLFGMFATQAIPTVGTIYYTMFCNDLTRQWAKLTFPTWCFASVMMAQCLEFFMFGGKNRRGIGVRMAEDKGCFGFFGGDAKVAGELPEKKGDGMDSAGEEMKMGEEGMEFDEDGMPLETWDAESSFATDSQLEVLELDQEGSTALLSSHSHEKQNEEEEEMEHDDENVLFERLKAEAAAKEAANKKRKLLEQRREEAKVKDWVTWKCIICKRKNRRPKFPKPSFEIGFGEKGEFYKRPYAIIVPDAGKARCTKCHTPLNYEPPMCSSHIFKHYEHQYRAFADYPRTVRVQSNMEAASDFANITAFFFGRQDNTSSKLVYNDWRLKHWAGNEMPENPRPIKPPNELFVRGEVVECMLQKAEVTRARIILAHSNHTYDIKYNSGEEIRFVEEKHLRLPGEKRAYSYVVEGAMTFLLIGQPFFMLIFAPAMENPGLTLIPVGLACLFLLTLRVLTFCYNFYRAYDAGCCKLFKMHSFFLVPLLLVTASSFSAAGTADGEWLSTAIFLSIALWSTVPLLYISRATFGAMAAILFLQASAAACLTAMWADETPIHDSLLVHMSPAFSMVLTLIFYRYLLTHLWDVHLTIRPLMAFDPLNDTLIGQLKMLYRTIFPQPDVDDEDEDDEDDFHDPYADLDDGELDEENMEDLTGLEAGKEPQEEEAEIVNMNEGEEEEEDGGGSRGSEHGDGSRDGSGDEGSTDDDKSEKD